MKKLMLVVSLFLLVGIAGKANAVVSGWASFTSTSVCIATGANLELLSISYSTGATEFNTHFLVVIDSSPLRVSQTGICNSSQTVGSMDYTLARFPVRQHIIPPIVLYSTVTANVVYNVGTTTLDFTDKDGDGLPVKNGLIFLQEGTSAGTIKTIRYRRRR